MQWISDSLKFSPFTKSKLRNFKNLSKNNSSMRMHTVEKVLKQRYVNLTKRSIKMKKNNENDDEFKAFGN